MKEIKIYKDTEELIHAVAEAICKVASEAIKERGQFNFVLSGGSSPKKLYELLASDAYKDRIDWSHTYFFFGDERFVPAGNEQRNSLMAQKALFEPLQIQPSQIFSVDTNGSPEDAAQKYAQTLKNHFDKKSVVFDYVLLGLGDNAHTASLFPHTAVLEESAATVKSVFVKEVHMYRITMTAPLINQARHVAFLVFGANKAEAVYHILKNDTKSPMEYPGKLIHPKSGSLHWFLDTEAFSVVQKNDEKIYLNKI